MENCIFYFSGTGNSLKAAKDIAERLGNCEINLMTKYKNSNRNFERIGFVFPVYAWGPPLCVENFIEQNASLLKNSYLFAVITYRQEAGAALDYLSKLLKKKKLRLKSGFEVKMPSNHIAYHENDTDEEIEDKNRKWLETLDRIIPVISGKKNRMETAPSLIDKIYKTGFKHKRAVRLFKALDRSFIVTGKCSGCGICAEVCPVRNINIKDRHPVWNHKCEQCLACLHWCPEQAIEYGMRTAGKKRYHHPGITLKEMIVKE